MAVSPDGRVVLTASSDGTVRMWDIWSGNELQRLTHAPRARSAAFSPDGRFVVSAGSNTLAVHPLDLTE